jgi:hypothetical protein
MKRKFILLFVILVLAAICIIPVSRQTTVLIKSSFVNVFTQLQTAKNWKKWRSDLRKASQMDSDKVSAKNFPDHFIINYSDLALDVQLKEGVFNVSEQNKNGNIKYNLTVLPDKVPSNALVVAENTLPLIKYLFSVFNNNLSDKTHITDLKNYLETDSLHYGYAIFKSRVPGTKLIVMRKTVKAENQFTEAAKMHSALKQFVKTHNLKRREPLIAQFIVSDKDSVQLTVGFFVDTILTGEGGIHFETMPKNGPGYAVKFRGKFNTRPKIYSAIRRYFGDHSIQPAILPFDIYLDDKLPTSDTSKVNIQSTICTFY